MVEKTKYDIIDKIGNIEIRKYPKIVLAVVEGYEGDSGFNYLFNYIKGNNEKQEKIPMTAPVISKKKHMSFVLPQNLELEDIPRPLNKQVKIKTRSEKNYAVLKFSGVANEKRISRYTKELIDNLEKNNIEVSGEPILMRYNSPFAPGFIRRNEIGIEIIN